MEERQRIFVDQGPYVFAALRRLGVPECDLADVAQDVFLVVFRRLDDFEGRSTLRTWLYGICLRVVADYRKRARRRRAVFASVSPERRPEPRGDARQLRELCARRGVADLERALASLDGDQRRVFVLSEIEQRAMGEVAQLCGCPLKTAFSRLYAARRRLRALLPPDTADAMPALLPGASLVAAGDAKRLSGLWRTLCDQAAAKTHMGTWFGLTKGAIAGGLAAAFAAIATLSSVPPEPLALATPVHSGPLSGAPVAIVERAPSTTLRPATPPHTPVRRVSRTGHRARSEPASPQAPAEADFAVERVSMPTLAVGFSRLALSEVVPYYYAEGAAPEPANVVLTSARSLDPRAFAPRALDLLDLP